MKRKLYTVKEDLEDEDSVILEYIFDQLSKIENINQDQIKEKLIEIINKYIRPFGIKEFKFGIKLKNIENTISLVKNYCSSLFMNPILNSAEQKSLLYTKALDLLNEVPLLTWLPFFVFVGW